MCCTDFLHNDIGVCYNIPSKMTPHINMLGPFMIHLIFSQMNSTLTTQNIAVTSCMRPRLLVNSLSHIASFTPYVSETYSASVVDNDTIDCKLAFQLIAELHKTKI